MDLIWPDFETDQELEEMLSSGKYELFVSEAHSML